MKKILVVFLLLCIIPINVLAKSSQNIDNVDFEPYMKDMMNGINKEWHPPLADYSKIVKLKFIVDKKGNVSNIRVFKSSDNPVFDTVAIKTIENYKFKPLPDEYKKKNIEIAFDFKQNVSAPLLCLNFCIVSKKEKQEQKYAKHLGIKIKKNWNTKFEKDPYEIMVNLKVDKNGTLISRKITSFSGDKSNNEALLKAIDTAKFKPPKKILKTPFEIDLVFSFNPIVPHVQPVPLFLPLYY